MTLQELISKKFPDITRGWDKWEADVALPVSLDGEAEIILYLIHQSGKEEKFVMKITDLELL